MNNKCRFIACEERGTVCPPCGCTGPCRHEGPTVCQHHHKVLEDLIDEVLSNLPPDPNEYRDLAISTGMVDLLT